MTSLVLKNEFELYQTADNRLFTKLTYVFLIATILFAVIVQLTELPPLTKEQRKQIPPSLTKVIERIKVEPKVEKPKPLPEIKPEEKPKAEPEKVETPKPVELKPKPPAKKALEIAKDQASKAGLVALADDLAALRDDFDITPMPQTVSKQADVKAPTTSETIKTNADVSKKVNVAESQQSTVAVQALAARELVALGDEVVTEAGGYHSDLEEVNAPTPEALEQRKVEAIRAVLDKNQGAFYTLYRRALRKDPSLQGKVTVEIVVAGNGRVSDCKILSSDLNAPELERKLINRIKMINFGSDLVSETRLNYSFNFLPF